jgi:Fur family peroxide stress response transcriptional regulator
MREIDQVIANFRKAGSKITPQRLTIFKLLKENREHPSAEDVYKQILKIHPSISFTTVYKTLQTLRDMGEIQELTIDPERAHYDPYVEDHIHTFCKVCGKIGDLDMDYQNWEFINISSSKVPDFEVHNVQVNFVGLCEDCRPQ